MKRLIFSIILGLVFLLVCFITIGIASEFMPETVWTLTKFRGESAPGILFIPFSIPIYFDILVRQERILPRIFDTVWFRISSLILFNWILYGVLGYWFIGRVQKLRMKKNYSNEPPPPSYELSK